MATQWRVLLCREAQRALLGCQAEDGVGDGEGLGAGVVVMVGATEGGGEGSDLENSLATKVKRVGL